jgi:hypothetical protein
VTAGEPCTAEVVLVRRVAISPDTSENSEGSKSALLL